MERRKARNWYAWLWLSPLLTLPTLAFFLFFGLYWDPAERAGILTAVLASALWHLVLLYPALNKDHPFVFWHGRQALLLAGVRTIVPLAFGLGFGANAGALLFIPVQMAVWFGGTLWGQLQATRGECSLMRWAGRGEFLASLRRAEEEAGLEDSDVEALLTTIRAGRDAAARRKATAQLKELGMVEPL